MQILREVSQKASDSLPGLRPWTPLGDFRPPDPSLFLCPPNNPVRSTPLLLKHSVATVHLTRVRPKCGGLMGLRDHARNELSTLNFKKNTLANCAIYYHSFRLKAALNVIVWNKRCTALCSQS